MKLKVQDRLMLLNQVLPAEGSFIELRLIKGIQKKIDFEAKEIGSINLSSIPVGNGRLEFNWDREKAKALDVKFEAAELDLLKGRIKILDGEKKIPISALELFEAINEEK